MFEVKTINETIVWWRLFVAISNFWRLKFDWNPGVDWHSDINFKVPRMFTRQLGIEKWLNMTWYYMTVRILGFLYYLHAKEKLVQKSTYFLVQDFDFFRILPFVWELGRYVGSSKASSRTKMLLSWFTNNKYIYAMKVYMY